MNPKIKPQDCDLRPALTVDEAKGLDWLLNTATRIANDHEKLNCERAQAAIRAFDRLAEYLDRCHTLLHHLQLLGNSAQAINAPAKEDEAEVPPAAGVPELTREAVAGHGVGAAFYSMTPLGKCPTIECLCGKAFYEENWERVGVHLDDHLEWVRENKEW